MWRCTTTCPDCGRGIPQAAMQEDGGRKFCHCLNCGVLLRRHSNPTNWLIDAIQVGTLLLPLFVGFGAGIYLLVAHFSLASLLLAVVLPVIGWEATLIMDRLQFPIFYHFEHWRPHCMKCKVELADDAEQCPACGGNAEPHPHDVMDDITWKTLKQEIREEWSKPPEHADEDPEVTVARIKRDAPRVYHVCGVICSLWPFALMYLAYHYFWDGQLPTDPGRLSTRYLGFYAAAGIAAIVTTIIAMVFSFHLGGGIAAAIVVEFRKEFKKAD